MYLQENIQCYLNEKEKREKRLEIYAEKQKVPNACSKALGTFC